jgi:RNase P subunit RPR2
MEDKTRICNHCGSNLRFAYRLSFYNQVCYICDSCGESIIFQEK